jgi:hypothetical protein
MNTESKDNFNLEQSVVNKAAEAAIGSQINSAQNIEVNIDSKVSQIIQGKANSLEIAAQKVVVFEDIQLEQLDVASDDLSLDLTQAILGKVALKQPGDFKIKIIFTKSDCDRLLNSEYVRVLLQNLPLEIGQQTANFYIKQAECNFKDDGKLLLAASIVLNRGQQTKTARFEIGIEFYRRGASIKFDGGKYIGETTLDLDETVAMMGKICDLLYLRHYNDANFSLDITDIELETEQEQLTLQGNARVKKLPDSIIESMKSVASEVNHN